MGDQMLVEGKHLSTGNGTFMTKVVGHMSVKFCSEICCRSFDCMERENRSRTDMVSRVLSHDAAGTFMANLNDCSMSLSTWVGRSALATNHGVRICSRSLAWSLIKATRRN